MLLGTLLHRHGAGQAWANIAGTQGDAAVSELKFVGMLKDELNAC